MNDAGYCEELGAFNGTAAAADSESLTEKRPPSQATLLLELLEDTGVEFFRDAANVCFGSIAVNGHRETWRLESNQFSSWCSRLFYERLDRALGANGRRDALAVVTAQALFSSKTYPVGLRSAQHEGAIYVDLSNTDWSVVKITAAGWSLVSARDCPVRFWRTRNMLALPEPQAGGSLDGLRPFVKNIEPRSLDLLKAYLVSALRANVPSPVLALSGPQGSGKSSIARRIRSLVDPNTSPLRSEPRDLRDFGAAARNNYVAAFDNLSSIPNWMSDALCRLATGGGIAGRELYTDAEEHIVDALRPTIITAIENVVVRGDLADRILLVPLTMIDEAKRRTEEELDAAFEALRPKLFGAILSAMSMALKRLAETRSSAKRLARLADFDLWARAALGGDFAKTYRAARQAASAAVLESSPLSEPLRKLTSENGEWYGTWTELFKRIVPEDERERRNGRWPKTPRMLSSAIERLIPDLRTIGLTVSVAEPDRDKRRLVTIVQKRKTASATSATSANPYRTRVRRADVQGRSADVADVSKNAPAETPAPDDPYRTGVPGPFAGVAGVADGAFDFTTRSRVEESVFAQERANAKAMRAALRRGSSEDEEEL